ncbi:MAG: PAS domain-containing protein, partial [Burkholderiales bacterium]|nr:PAS domain-containing protein [Burkholderiales bacterium]
MTAATTPADEALRLQLLHELDILDSDPEPSFDALTRCARLMSGYSMAFVSLIDETRQWFKSRDGLEVREIPREMAFCAHALHADTLLEVADAACDPRFSDNPYVSGPSPIRAYASQPIVVCGIRLGTLCVVDPQPRSLSGPQREMLAALARAGAGLLEERLNRHRLAVQQQRMADFGDASGDWLWETDATDRVVWLSPGFEGSSGRSPVSVLNQTLPDGPLLDLRGHGLQPPRTLLQGLGRRAAFSRATIEWPGPEGPSFVSFSAVPVIGRDGGFAGFRGTARDVTERVHAEREREAAVDRLRRLVDQVPGALYLFRAGPDGGSSFPYASEAFEALFEVAPTVAARTAEPVFQRIHAEDLARVQASIERSRAELSPWQMVFRVCLPLRGERHLSAHSTPTREADGAVLWHGLVTDITQDVLQRHERERLRRERDQAKREVDTRAETLSRMSHELRTPLNAILGFTQLLQQSIRQRPAADPSWPGWVHQVHRAATHLLALVNDVLDLASLEARRFAVDLQATELASVFVGTMELLRPQADARRQRLEIDIDPAVSSVLADKRALRQVLINLLGNASKFTPEGGRIGLTARDFDGRVQIEVEDDGPGIPAPLLARLFKPFERGAESTGGVQGTGLGLVISRQLVGAMGGKLSVRSTVGRGTTFSFRLPVAQEVDAPTTSTSLFGAFSPEAEGVDEA